MSITEKLKEIEGIQNLTNFIELQKEVVESYGYPFYQNIESFSNTFKIVSIQNNELALSVLEKNDLLLIKYNSNSLLFTSFDPRELLLDKQINFSFFEQKENYFVPLGYSGPTIFYYPNLNNKYFIFGLEHNEIDRTQKLDSEFDYIEWLKSNDAEYYNEENTKTYLAMMNIPQKIEHIDYDGLIGITREIYRYFKGDDSSFDLSDITKLFNYQIANNSSDLHINSGSENYTIQDRLYGELRTIGKVTVSTAQNFITKIKSDSNEDEFNQTKETKRTIKHLSNGEERTFRISISPTIYGPKMVSRLVPSKISSIEELNFPKEIEIRLMKLIHKDTGIKKASKAIAICGPTGVGKSATASSIVRAAADNNRLITEIGNPIEFEQKHKNITQISLADDDNADDEVKNTMLKVANATKRQDQDILYITELQTDEEKNEAIRLGAQGHGLIFSVHTSSNFETLEDLSESTKKPISRLVHNLGIIMNQALIPAQCKRCSGSGSLGSKTCHVCNGSGEYGRVPIVEYWQAKKLGPKEHYPEIIDSANYRSEEVCDFFYTFEDSILAQHKEGKISTKTKNLYLKG